MNMLVTALEPTKRGRISLYCDGEFRCALHPDVAVAAGLQPGMEIAPARLEELTAESGRKITKDRALSLLSRQAYTSGRLLEKLRAYADEEIALDTIARMEELGLIDDWDYGRRYAEYCVKQKGFSQRRTLQALRERGIPREISEAVMEEREDDPEQAIAVVVCGKYLHALDDEKGRNRAYNALLRLGYRHGDIRRVLANLDEDRSYYDK